MKTWKKVLIIILSCVLVASAFVGIESAWRKHMSKVAAAGGGTTGVVDAATGKFIIPTESGELGSETNPFVVLEIVPNESMAQFGYLVSGQEPIDIMAATEAAATNATVSERLENVTEQFLTATYGTEVRKEFANLLGELEEGQSLDMGTTIKQYGTYEYVGEGTGDYKLVVDTLPQRAELDEEKSTSYTKSEYLLDEEEKNHVINTENKSVGLGNGAYSRDYRLENEDEGDYALGYYRAVNSMNGSTISTSGKYIITFSYNDTAAGGREIRYDVSSYSSSKLYYKKNDSKLYTSSKGTTEIPRAYNYSNRNGNYSSGNSFHVIFAQSSGGKYVPSVNLIGDDDPKKNAFKLYTFVAGGTSFTPCPKGAPDAKYVKLNGRGDPEFLGEGLGDWDRIATVEKLVYNYYDQYGYHFEYVGAGMGDYNWIGESYEFNATADASEYAGLANTEEIVYEAGVDEITKSVKATKDETLFTIYEGRENTSEDLFKKYALGLGYKDSTYQNGEDTVAYNFIGWYTEPECINRFRTDTPVNASMRLYAKWEVVLPSGTDNNTVTFNANGGKMLNTDTLADEDTFTTDFIWTGSKLSNPASLPKKEGKVFNGWYLSTEDAAAGTNPVNFAEYTVNDDVTLYAGWTDLDERTYHIEFNLNGDVGETFTSIIAPVDDYRENGYRTGLSTGEPADPEREGYVFKGWFYEQAEDLQDDSTRFTFGAPLPERIVTNEESNVITLYAGWTTAGRKVRVTYDANKPAGAIAVPHVIDGDTRSGSTLLVEPISGSKLAEEETLLPTVTLAGNTTERIAGYNVKVITITPKDLNIADNLKLIDRADLIVFNQTSNSDVQELWKSYRNPVLFSKNASAYNSTATSFGSSGVDLPWNAVVRIIQKIINNGSCPVLFDYSTIDTVKAATKATTTNKNADKFSAKYSDTGTYTSSVAADKYGFSSNIYKLYLLTQQMNPATAYNVYLRANKKITDAGEFKGATRNYKFWDTDTLLPYGAMTQLEGQNSRDGILEMLNVTTNVTLETNNSRVKNHVYLYNNSVANMVNGFTQSSYTATVDDDVQKKLDPEATTGKVYKPADILYYLLHYSDDRQYLKDRLSVLELEPCDTFRSQEYWDWYISRYVPSFAGVVSVTKMSTSEFVGKIEDLNSNYDVVYFGANTDSMITGYMPANTKKTTNSTSGVTLDVTQTIGSSYQKKATSGSITGYTTTYSIISPETYNSLSASAKTEYTEVDINNMITVGNTRVSGDYYNAMLAASMPAWFTTCGISVTSSDDDYYAGYRTSKSTTKITDYDTFALSVSAGEHSDTAEGVGNAKITWSKSSSGNLYKYKYSSSYYGGGWSYVEQGGFRLHFYYRTESEPIYGGGTWIDCAAGTVAYAGDVIRPRSGSIDYLTTNYVYTHVGRLISYSASDSTYDKKEDLFGWLSDSYAKSNDVSKLNYSGNDISSTKLKELQDFVNAGYPIMISRDLLTKDGKGNEKMIDNSSYIYEFLKDVQDNHPLSCFLENDRSHDDQFLDALMNKNFSVDMLSGPTEFAGGNYLNSTNTLEYIISINSEEKYPVPKANYQVALYIDANADGKYSDDEKIDSLEITDRTGNRPKGYGPDSVILSSENTYTIVRPIVDRIGIMPWKLVIYDMTNPSIREELTGYSAIRAKDGEKEILNVLQISQANKVTESGSRLNGQQAIGPTVLFPTQEEYEKAKAKHGGADITESNASNYFDGVIDFSQYTQTKNILWQNNTYSLNADKCLTTGNGESNNLIKNAGLFYYYTHNLSEFEINFYRVAADEFARRVDDGKIYMDNKTGSFYFTQGEDKIQINMIIMGYADCFTSMSDGKSLDYVQNFIDAGNAMLFTHDTTSRSPNDRWGLTITKTFRSMLGMDRFDVVNNRGRIDRVDASTSDKPYELGSARTEYQTNLISAGNERVVAHGYTSYQIDNGMLGHGTQTTNKATKTNDGQIVTYPYPIPDELSVATTHAQYYQLDFDIDADVDGEEEIAVWYCLTGSSDFYKAHNDTRNNYYIYNKGNITYSGVGHNSNMSNDEIMLFVNTMVASYRSTVQPSKPEIINDDKSSEGTDTDFLYIDYDATADASSAAPVGYEIINREVVTPSGSTIPVSFKRVKFRLRNYSIVKNKELVVTYYPAERVMEDGHEIYRPVDPDTSDSNDRPYSLNNSLGKGAAKLDNYTFYLPTYRVADDHLMSEYKRFTHTYEEDGEEKSVSYEGVLLDTLVDYYVDIPITDNYYKEFLGLDNFALNSDNNFCIYFEVAMKYGNYELKEGTKVESAEYSYEEDETVFAPKIGFRNAVFVRRGIFTLD